MRRFCFLNLNRPAHPAAIIVLDDITTSRPEYKKFWQLNTLNPPQTTADGVALWNTMGGKKGRLDVRMLWPARDARTVEVLSGAAANSVFGQAFTPPLPAAPVANGHRIMLAPQLAQARDRLRSCCKPATASSADRTQRVGRAVNADCRPPIAAKNANCSVRPGDSGS